MKPKTQERLMKITYPIIWMIGILTLIAFSIPFYSTLLFSGDQFTTEWGASGTFIETKLTHEGWVCEVLWDTEPTTVTIEEHTFTFIDGKRPGRVYWKDIIWEK